MAGGSIARKVGAMSDKGVLTRYFDWSHWAYEQQREPAGDWTTWLFMGGRGCGKTRTGAEWVRSLAARQVSPIALVGETMAEAMSIMVRGESGIVDVCANGEQPTIKGHRLEWPNGVEAMLMSASDPDRFRGPQFAAAWFTELGCGAVDKGANQPNIFGDAKSAEDGRPYFSRGTPDALIQRQVLRAHQHFWRDPANNPPGMVDVERLYLWTWDARPYPAFPALTEVWSDGENHRNGHWLTGRLGGMGMDELAEAVAAEHGVRLTAEPAAPFVTGCVLGSATTARQALEPLVEASGLTLRNRRDGLHQGKARRVVATTFAPDDLVRDDGAVLSRRSGDPAEMPGRLALTYQDRERDYLAATVTAMIAGDGPLVGESLALTLDGASARLAAERMLDGRAARRETLELTLPPSALALEPGDLIEIDGLAEGPFEIGEIRDGLARKVVAHGLLSGLAVATGVDRGLTQGTGVAPRSLPLVVAAHLPPLPGEPTRSRLVLATHAQPWPGVVQVVDDATGLSLVEIGRRGLVGELLAPLRPGPLGVWDRANAIEINLFAGHLAAADERAVLAGSNRLAVETDAGDWEIVGFARAELVAPGRYRLSQLLRGQEGTGPAMRPASTGRRVFVLNRRDGGLPVETQYLGESRALRIYAGARDVEGTSLSVATGLGPALPLPPVHLRARRAGGDIALHWTRCSRADGDGWGVAESPLEHSPELYRVTIAAVSRQFDCATPFATYSAAQQLADFGGPAAAFTFTIAHISPVLGAGHAAQGVFHG